MTSTMKLLLAGSNALLQSTTLPSIPNNEKDLIDKELFV